MSTVKAANLQNTGSGAPAFKNSSGTEIGQLAKAWVNFNGEGTVAIRDSFNVSSVSDIGTGQHVISFTNDMANANYAAFCVSSNDEGNGQGAWSVVYSSTTTLTGSVRIVGHNSGGAHMDQEQFSVVVFGD